MTWCCEIADLNKFILTAKSNEIFKYYTGLSVQDTIFSKEVGKLCYDYSTRGIVYLVQKRSLGYFFDFDHYLIKASYMPVYSLVPLSDDKTEHLRRRRGVRNYGKVERAG